MNSLNVFILGQLAGRISLDKCTGRLSFAYDPAYEGPDLSCAMPFSRGVSFADRKTRAWFAGVLPDNPDVREGMSKDTGGGRSEFALIAHYGMELPGAIQVAADGVPISGETASYLELSRVEIGERLREIIAGESEGASRTWMTAKERWSLAGGQPKIALRREAGVYSECRGSAASNVIVKPGVQGARFAHQALCECVSMRLAKLCGLRCADVAIEDFDGVQAVVVERYDRLSTPAGAIVRLHQEDLCQATSVYPDQKYAADGGPNSIGAMELLEDASDGQESRLRFYDALAFNHLIAATDAHGKNYSLLHTARGRFQLAPLYDIASIAPYMLAKSEMRRETGSRASYRTAMSIGGENVIGKLRQTSVRKFAKTCGLPEDDLLDRTEALAESVKAALAAALDAFSDAEGIDWLASLLVPRITALCDTTAHNLHATGRAVKYLDVGEIPAM